ncbi:MAG: CsbD family protein [Hyphomonadaceae bacterium]
MNKDQIKGAIKEAAGKVQKEFGKAVDSPKHEIAGGMKEVAGKTQKAVGNIKDDVKDVRKDANREGEKRRY